MNAFALVVVMISLTLLADGGSAECRKDWVTFEESCYVFIDEFVTWSTANQICQAVKSRLVEVNSQAENEFIASQLRTRKLNIVWTGIQDFVREGTWVTSSDQKRATYFNWRSGEPNNDGGSEGGQDCVTVLDNGMWDDDWCDHSHNVAVVCESPLADDALIG